MVLAACSAGTGVEQTIVTGGDCMFDRDGETLSGAAADAALTRWRGIVSTLRESDAFLFNLETTVGQGGTPRKEQFVFRSPPRVLDDLRLVPRRVACLANNHSMDYGIEGLSGTLRALSAAGISHAGAGANRAEAFRPAALALGGVRIVVFSAGVDNEETAFAGNNRPGIAQIDSAVLQRGIAGARGVSTAVVVMLHWGIEYQTMYASEQRALAHALVDAGADLVVGTGPHVLQGIERRGGALICYSLGNLIFDDLQNGETSAGVLLRMRIFSVAGAITRKSFAIAPLRTKSRWEGPRASTPEDGEGIVWSIASRSPDPSVIHRSAHSTEGGLSWFEVQ